MCRDNLKRIRSKVGFVFQDPDDQLFSPTVFDDIAFGPLNLGLSKDEACERVKQALEQVGMTGYEKRTPHHLSSGEKKKLSIATVLSLPCELLILDEPTANLDPRARKNLAQVLKRLGLTTVIASHDLAFVADVCTRIVVLENGRVVAHGVPRGLFSDQKLREKYHYEMDLSSPARE
jgi:energy-coupling factor transporter ATP-binding protein EcfA2